MPVKEPSRSAGLCARILEWCHTDAARNSGWLGRGFEFLIEVIRGFIRNRGPVRASALAYATLLALVPLLAISLSAAALFLPKKEDERTKQLLVWMEFAVTRAAPTLGLSAEDGSDQRERVAAQIVSFVERIHFRTIGAAATVGLLILAIGLLRAVETTFNDIWGVEKCRSPGISIVYYWAIVTLGPVIILASKGASYASLLDGTSFLAAGHRLAPAMVALSFAVFPVMMWLVFALLYWWMPNTRVDWRAALVGGAVASVLWTLNGKLSALYNTRVLTNNAIYGSLGILPLFLVGLYFTWAIVLFGAQVTCTFQTRARTRSASSGGGTQSEARLACALQLMTEIGAHFRAGSKPPGVRRLAEIVGVPEPLVGDLIAKLLKVGLLHETAGPAPGFTPARPLNLITMYHVMVAIRPTEPNGGPTGSGGSAPAIVSALERVNQVANDTAKSISLESLTDHAPPGELRAGSGEVAG